MATDQSGPTVEHAADSDGTELPMATTVAAAAVAVAVLLPVVWLVKTALEVGFDEAVEEEQKSHVTAHVWNELPYAFWDHWLDEDRHNHLFRIAADGVQDVGREREVEHLLDDDRPDDVVGLRVRARADGGRGLGRGRRRARRPLGR